MSATQPKPRYTLKDLKKAPPPARPQRLPPLNVPEDYMNLPYLDDEEKELCGIQLVSRLEKFDSQATITVATAAHDPRAARVRSAFGAGLMSLASTSYETRHLVGGSLLNLLVLTVVRWAGDECLYGSISRGVQDHYLEGFKPHYVGLIDFPDSEVWSKEQRLMLRFTRAVLDNTMTDELWGEAVAAWNPKICVRYIHVICFFLGASMMNRTLGVKYPGERREGGRVPGVESQINKERAEYLKRVRGG